MNRRSFLGLGLAATGGIFVPQFGKWYRQASGLLVPRPPKGKLCIYSSGGQLIAALDVSPLLGVAYPTNELYQGTFSGYGMIGHAELNSRPLHVSWNGDTGTPVVPGMCLQVNVTNA